MMKKTEVFEDSAKKLLGALSGEVDEKLTRSKYWPQTPRKLAGDLRRLAPALRKLGITIDFDRRALTMARTRLIRIEAVRSRVMNRPNVQSSTMGRNRPGILGRFPNRPTIVQPNALNFK
jgi:hypothetical protein